MSNNRFKKGKEVRDTKAGQDPPKIKVDHSNAPLLTVHFLEVIANELKRMNEIMENADG